MKRSSPSFAPRHLVAAVAALLFATPLFVGCSSDMDPKECDKLRGEAFDLLNEAQHCNADADCKRSEWPQCGKPLTTVANNNKPSHFDGVKQRRDAFTKGKCQEPKNECKDTVEVYCKTGLCVRREPGVKEGSGNTPLDKIEIH